MTLEETLRGLVRDVLRDELPGLLKAALPQVAASGAPVLDGYLATNAAARLAGVRPETIRRWIDAGDLPVHRAGRLVRVRRSELEAYLARGRKMADQPIDLEKRAREILGGRRVGGRG